MRKQRGTPSRCAEKVLGYQVHGLGLFHLIRKEAYEFTLNTQNKGRERSIGGFGSCLGGSNVDECKVTKREVRSTSHPVPDPVLWREH